MGSVREIDASQICAKYILCQFKETPHIIPVEKTEHTYSNQPKPFQKSRLKEKRGTARPNTCYSEEVKVYVKSQAHSKERKHSQGEKERRRKGKAKHTGMRGFGPHFAQTGCVALCRINAYSSSYLHQLPGQMQPLEITGITQGILKTLSRLRYKVVKMRMDWSITKRSVEMMPLLTLESVHQKDVFRDLPGGTVDKNPPVNAGISLVQEIPHTMEQLSLCTPATVYPTEACVLQLLKSKHLEPVLHDRRSHHNEKPVHHNFD
ncbi:hypothetical protein MJG53_010305 [Ovis ammon polii x Ovis aries]|uniref:Uncharacterized protein n=1 Tax=Ovis ammon polii x Ovis aries TaxID=2918886 RepID=A0ACB9UTH2_9CETA|nr:hypothetical protein MJG53_010305 [Ovis ammon polii x Ovis aries]